MKKDRIKKIDKILKTHTQESWLDDFNLGLPQITQQPQSPQSQSQLPLFPIVKQVFAQTIGLNLVAVKPMSYPYSLEEEIKKTKRELRKDKLKAVFESPLKRKIKGVIKNTFRKIFSIFKKKNFKKKNLVKIEPKGKLMYLDFKYGSQNSSPKKIYKKKLFRKRDR